MVNRDMPDMTLKTTKEFMPKASAAKVVSVLLNVSYALKIDADTLVRIFRGEEPTDKWFILLDEFFSDCPLPFIQRFMQENEFTLNDVKDVFFKLPLSLQSGRFKGVLADGTLR
jgi:hypothetical protein